MTLSSSPQRMTTRDSGNWLEDHDETDMGNYLSVIARNKGLILKVATLVALVAVVAVYSMESVYRSTATLLIESEEKNVISIQGINGPVTLTDEYMETQNQILQSRKLAVQVIDELQLARHPEFDPAAMSLLQRLNPLRLLPGNDVSSEQGIEDRVVAAFFERLDIRPVTGSQLIRISFYSSDPELAALVPNTLADVYIENHQQSRLLDTREATEWMAVRLSDLRASMEQSEAALQEFRDQEQLIDLSGVGTLTASELEEITNTLVEARRSQAEAAALLAQGGGAAGSHDSIPAVLADQGVRSARDAKAAAENRISELRSRYGPLHPTMIEAQAQLETASENVDTQIANVIQSLERQYEVAGAQVAQLTADLEAARGDAAGINRMQASLTSLEREVETNRQLHDTFVTRLKETMATDSLLPANARLVDTATVPTLPVAPNKSLAVLVAFLGACAAMCFVAFMREAMDNTMKFSADVERRLRYPVLGVLPKLPGGLFAGKFRSINFYAANKESPFAENIRTVRTNLLFPELALLPENVNQPADPAKEGKVLLVTSSIRSEGKSTVATNLAFSLSQMGKVLLIDADLRNPVVSKALRMERNGTIGLSDYLSGEQPLKSCIQECDGESLRVMPGGDASLESLEMLSSERFQQMIATMKRHFDHIVIDSPPVIPVSDALVLARYADAVLFIVKAGETPYPLAQEGLKRLKHASAPLTGVILNQVTILSKPEHFGDYHHADYYSIAGYAHA